MLGRASLFALKNSSKGFGGTKIFKFHKPALQVRVIHQESSETKPAESHVGDEIGVFPPVVTGEGGAILADGVLGTLSTLECSLMQDVFQDQVIATIETDQMPLEVRAPKDGTVTALHVIPGIEVKENQRIVTLLTD